MRPISACYTSGRGNSLNRALFELRPLHYKSISACEVDILVRNPYWLVDSILFLSINLSSLLLYSFSRILENWHSRDIGL